MMNDEIDKPEDEEPMSQDEINELIGGGEELDEMSFDEIEGSDLYDDDEQEYDIGEPMAGDVTAIYDIPVQISAVLGRSTMQVSQLLKLGRGAVVELDRKVGEAIDIYVNNRLVARGEVVVVEDKLGVTMTEIVKSDRS
jgi:flagellar motor switch protein FliN/FliY